MQKTKETKRVIASTFSVMVSKKMVTLHLYIIYAGVVVTYFCGMVPILVNDKLKHQGITDKVTINRYTALVMIFFGLADAIGGYFCGKITNVLGKRMGMLVILLIGLLAVSVTYIAEYYVIRPCFSGDTR